VADIRYAALAGKTAVVTGGGRGLGAAIAATLVAHRLRVAVVARTSAEIEAVAASLRDRGGECVAVRCDVARAESVHRAHREVVRALGLVDVLVNNASVIWPMGATASVPLEEWTDALAINVNGVFSWTQAVLPEMLRRRWGRLITISSGAAVGTGMVPANAYSVSKAAIEMLTRNLAAELAGTGVQVHAVQPGLLNTDMQTYIREQSPALIGVSLSAAHRRFKTQGRLLDPAEPAALVARLLLEQTSGEIINIGDRRGRYLLADR
jgi:NAD(P)-dependent dehydrogenase (short-subunit alcohol dehydrogenase family)